MPEAVTSELGGPGLVVPEPDLSRAV
jgi:hypothetical protein